MIWAAIETIVAFAAVAWIPSEVDKYFAKNLIPLPAWPYGVSLAVFTFFFIKTLFVFVRSLVSGALIQRREVKS